MVWMRKERDTSVHYIRLSDENGCKKRVPKGYVPVLVGGDTAEDEEERFFVHIKLLKEPSIATLLEQAAEQFGYQEGVLRVPCDARCFQHTIDLISRGR
ncbi:Auxin-responsive protein SAUR71 [Carex littledalei]|uniref:Auxin-responsive protein SAUR71 n=1 Tax=Carex littledalei TaxID=544730 RepID=A0A833R9G4_9POAL|nr:Auxin-responsive protein SAUR71 [Carex littledalei]